MILRRLRNFAAGYLELRLVGNKPKFFLNQVLKQGIHLWDIRLEQSNILRAKVSYHDFRLLRPLVRKSRCRLKIIAKCGWPKLWPKIYLRRFFGVGLMLFCILFWYFSGIILWIKIENAPPNQHREILRVLASIGLERGIKKEKILTQKRQLELQAMMQLPQLVWLGIEVDGAVATVKAIPRRRATKAETNGSLFASEAGVVEKITVFRGIPVIDEGGTVDRGELLIEGVQRLANPDTQDLQETMLPASGVVEARVWRTIEVWEPYEIWQGTAVGKAKKVYSLKIGEKTLTLWGKGRIPAGNYFWERGYKRIKCGRNTFKNVEFIKDIYHEAKWHLLKRQPATVRQIALQEAKNRQRELGYNKPQSTVVDYSDESGFCHLTMTLEFIWNIATFVPERKGSK